MPNQSPLRIVSMVPSATEIVCGLGLRDHLVGVSHECDFPPHVKELPKVTRSRIPEDATSGEIDSIVRDSAKNDNSLYDLDLETLLSLAPNLIITQSLCNVCAVAEDDVDAAARQLSEPPQIIRLQPNSLADVFEGIREVGKAANHLIPSLAYVGTLIGRLSSVNARSRSVTHRPRVVLLEWIDPLFCAGHWNPELIGFSGGMEMLGVAGARSQSVSWEQLIAVDPEVLLIACCGFDVERSIEDVSRLTERPGWRSLSCVASERVYVIDGSAYCNRPGPRLLDSLEMIAHTLHPEIHPLPAGLPNATPVSL